MTAQTKVTNPIMAVLLCFLSGILGIVVSLTTTSFVTGTQDPRLVQFGWWIPPVSNFYLILSIAQFASGFLLMFYKRIGLIIGAVASAICILVALFFGIVGLLSTITFVLSVVIHVAVLQYTYRYLTDPREKEFFT
jgi:hypothetical protein